MSLSVLDISIIFIYLAGSLFIGFYAAKRGGKNLESYFVGDRQMPWWLIGVSMIASALSIDTPLGITGLVAKYGVQGVWLAWAFIIGGAGAFGAIFFAPLIRRSQIITNAELAELRYDGRSAAVLRGFKGVYFGLLTLSISMGWVFRSVLVVTQEALHWDVTMSLAVIIAVTILYTMASGIWGVVLTDFFQFFVAIFGLIVLAVYAVDDVGGLSELLRKFHQTYDHTSPHRLNFIPHSEDKFFVSFMLLITLKWWNNPTATMAQRMMSAKSDRDASLATLLFSLVHFALNYWPMILVALVSLVTYPNLPVERAEQGYAMIMVKVLPHGLLGLVIAALIAAYMSTVSAQANTGASFMVRDIYQRFINPTADEKKLVNVGRVSTFLMLILAVIMAYFMTSVRAAWEYLLTLTAGYGFVTVARWFWWRINAWSEFAALLSSGIGSVIATQFLKLESFGHRFAFVSSTSLICWITVTFLTKPVSMDQLATFCRRVRTYPLLWKPVQDAYPDILWSDTLLRDIFLWAVAVTGMFSVCFGVGHLLIGSTIYGLILLAVALASAAALHLTWREQSPPPPT